MDTNTFVQWVTVIKENIIGGDPLVLVAVVMVVFAAVYLMVWATSCIRAIVDALACLISLGKIIPVEEKPEPSYFSKLVEKLKTMKMPLPLPPKKETPPVGLLKK